jgi:hypothetical protein
MLRGAHEDYTSSTAPFTKGALVMIDSLLTLTKRGAFWLAIFFAAAVLMNVTISALVGQQEPMFALFALAIAAIFIVSGTYTLFKTVIGLFKHDAEKAPDE